MYKIRTDLALELRESIIEKGELDDGIIFENTEYEGISCSTIEITNINASETTGRDIGTYITIEFGKIWLKSNEEFQNTVDFISKKLLELSDFKKEKSILVVGLGNIYVTPDALGPKSLSKILISRHLKESMPLLYKEFGMVNISGISPGVLGQTGIESAEIILSLVRKINPELVIIIDALASRKVSRLATTIQLSNTGISPGSGVGNHRMAINKKFLGTDVISIGVPTVVDAATLAYDVLEETYEKNNIIPNEQLNIEIIKNTLEQEGNNFFVTPKENDTIINEVSKVIGYSINRAFYHNLDFDEMARLI